MDVVCVCVCVGGGGGGGGGGMHARIKCCLVQSTYMYADKNTSIVHIRGFKFSSQFQAGSLRWGEQSQDKKKPIISRLVSVRACRLQLRDVERMRVDGMEEERDGVERTQEPRQ